MSFEANLVLRQAHESDLPGLLARDAYAQAQETRRHELRRWVEQQSCFVAAVRDEPVGFVVIQYTFFGNGFIPLISVAAAYQRQGIGQFLLAQAERLCTIPKLFTSANASNSRAQRLFGRAGFAASGTIENLDVADPELIYFKVVRTVRISAIVDACFRLIVDGDSAPSMRALGKRASSGLNVAQSSTISLKRAVAGL